MNAMQLLAYLLALWIVAWVGSRLAQPVLVPLVAGALFGILPLWLYARRRHPGHPWGRWLGSLFRRPAGVVVAAWCWALGTALLAAEAGAGRVLAGPTLGGAGLTFAAGAAVLLLYALPLAHLRRRPTMPRYLHLLGGGGAAEVKDRLAGHPLRRDGGLRIPDDLAARLRERVIGQDAVLDELASLVQRRARLRRSGKPLATALLVGATGAGKTETVRALAEACAPDGADSAHLVRIDCAELADQHGLQRLIGAPPGYIGSEAGGQLTRALMASPGGVLLLDEIEKAHQLVIQALMALLDEGRLTEQSTGHVADASGYLILATSNAAHEEIAEIAASGDDDAERRRRIKDALRAHMRPEVLARWDAVLPYRPLDLDARIELTLLMLQRLATEAGCEIVAGGVDPAAVEQAIRRGHALARYGARELARALERELMDGLLDAHDRLGPDAPIRITAEPDTGALRVVALGPDDLRAPAALRPATARGAAR